MPKTMDKIVGGDSDKAPAGSCTAPYFGRKVTAAIELGHQYTPILPGQTLEDGQTITFSCKNLDHVLQGPGTFRCEDGKFISAYYKGMQESLTPQWQCAAAGSCILPDFNDGRLGARVIAVIAQKYHPRNANLPPIHDTPLKKLLPGKTVNNGKTIAFQCPPGYQLRGPTQITCESGKFDVDLQKSQWECYSERIFSNLQDEFGNSEDSHRLQNPQWQSQTELKTNQLTLSAILDSDSEDSDEEVPNQDYQSVISSPPQPIGPLVEESFPPQRLLGPVYLDYDYLDFDYDHHDPQQDSDYYYGDKLRNRAARFSNAVKGKAECETAFDGAEKKLKDVLSDVQLKLKGAESAAAKAFEEAKAFFMNKNNWQPDCPSLLSFVKNTFGENVNWKNAQELNVDPVYWVEFLNPSLEEKATERWNNYVQAWKEYDVLVAALKNKLPSLQGRLALELHQTSFKEQLGAQADLMHGLDYNGYENAIKDYEKKSTEKTIAKEE